MDEQKVKQLIKDEMVRNYRSGAPLVPPHQHTGNDGLRVSTRNLATNAACSISIHATPGTAVENQLTIKGLSNPKTVYFYGIFNDNPGDTAQRKAEITGTAQLGDVSYFIPITATYGINTPSATDPAEGLFSFPNIIQTCTSIGFLNVSGTVWVPYVFVDPFSIGGVKINGHVYGRIQIVSYTNTTITVQAPLDANCEIFGTLIIT